MRAYLYDGMVTESKGTGEERAHPTGPMAATAGGVGRLSYE
jgi:hypothetical protein